MARHFKLHVSLNTHFDRDQISVALKQDKFIRPNQTSLPSDIEFNGEGVPIDPLRSMGTP